MNRKVLSMLLGAAMVASVFSSLPAFAAGITVPEEPLIVDPSGDANYLNDQGQAGTGLTGTATVPDAGDNGTPEDAGSISDVIAAWLTADADNVYAHFQTEAPGPSQAALFYRMRIDPGVGSRCLWFQAGTPGAGNTQSEAKPSLRTLAPCDPVQTVSEGAEFTQEEAEDGTGIHTIKIPRVLSPYLADGAILASPKVDVTHYTLSPPVPTVTSGASLTAPTIDNTKPGLDWTISVTPGGTVDPGPGTDPDPDEPKKKNCKKKKGKAKKKCKKYNKQIGKDPAGNPDPGGPKGPACDPYVPGEEGAEAETAVVTDEHTAEAPLEITVTHAPPPDSFGESFWHNVQVDSKAAEAGLYISYEFAEYEDHDLYVNYADGTEAGHVGGFNPAPVVPQLPEVGGTDGTGHGGHSEIGAEVLDGLRTADCAGYTVDFHGFLTEGGDYTAKLWLGEVQNDPAPPAS